MKRSCKVCEIEQDIELFPVAKIINEVKYYRHKCQKCYWAMKRKRRHAIGDWLNALKKELSCEKCGEADFVVLEFHHSKGKKEFCVANGVRRGLSRERILAEIDKCTVLCANCHRRLHYNLELE